MRMAMPCPVREFNANRNSAAHQRLSLDKPVGVLKQCGEVVEIACDIGVVWPKAPFVDGERTAHQRLSLNKSVGILQQLGEVVEADRDLGIVWSEDLFVDG